ncbi:MAG: DUF58 domain-containing protein [Psychromonas sp.]|nr:DUF58 domain-containing protein [Psychromonas sp.]
MNKERNKPKLLMHTPYSSGVDIQLSELIGYKQHAKIRLEPIASVAYSARTGKYLAKIKGRGMEFLEVRHYQVGDDVRSIDWAVTARTGKAHTKLYQEEKERPVFILVDLSDSMIFGSQLVFKSVQAMHLAALLSWQANQRNDRLGGIIFNQNKVSELKPTARSKGLLSFLYQGQNLCLSKPLAATSDELNTAKQTLLAQLKHLYRLAQTGCQIHLISDFSQIDNACKKVINRMKKHNQISAWQINDPLELTLPVQVNSAQIKVNTLTATGFINPKTTNNAYTNSAKIRQEKINDCFTKQGIDLYHVCSSKPLMEQFHARKQQC